MVTDCSAIIYCTAYPLETRQQGGEVNLPFYPLLIKYTNTMAMHVELQGAPDDQVLLLEMNQKDSLFRISLKRKKVIIIKLI